MPVSYNCCYGIIRNYCACCVYSICLCRFECGPITIETPHNVFSCRQRQFITLVQLISRNIITRIKYVVRSCLVFVCAGTKSFTRAGSENCDNNPNVCVAGFKSKSIDVRPIAFTCAYDVCWHQVNRARPPTGLTGISALRFFATLLCLSVRCSEWILCGCGAHNMTQMGRQWRRRLRRRWRLFVAVQCDRFCAKGRSPIFRFHSQITHTHTPSRSQTVDGAFYDTFVVDVVIIGLCSSFD